MQSSATLLIKSFLTNYTHRETMKKITLSAGRIINSIFAGILAALGFSSCGETPDMYGTPISTFEVKGAVTDENSKPVANAEIIMRYINREEVFTLPGDTILTNKDGEYTFADQQYYSNQIRMVCKPKGDKLEADSIDLPQLSLYKKTYKINFSLKPKKQQD